jgi:SAM-dependent methyltransferase
MEPIVEVTSNGAALRRLLKWLVPRCWEDGVARCNELGKELVAAGPVDKLLDVGCGDGRVTREFADVMQAKEVYGIEYVDDLADRARENGVISLKSDLNESWPFERDSFDVVLSSQNIEHVHNTRLYLEEAYRCLKPGGRLLVLTENLSSWGNIGALIMGWQPFSTTHINGWDLGNPLIWNSGDCGDEAVRQTWQGMGLSGAAGHVRVLAYKGLEELLFKVGFRDVRVNTRGYLPLWGKSSDFFCRIDPRHGHFLVAIGAKP